jgi:N-methylhydantoinase B
VSEAGIDLVRIEILRNALRSATDEMYLSLMRSSYSTNIKERHDHSTSILDRHGRLIVQSEASLPIHIASMTGLTRLVLERFSGVMAEGDLYIANDPHVAGGSHLPDISMAAPFYFDGKLFGFICNIAHHADIGGMAAGSMAGGMSEIYQEGLRIPAIRLFQRGELQSDLFDLLLLNVRVPSERRGDYLAQVAACRLGLRRLEEVVRANGPAVVDRVFSELLDRTHKRMRRAIGRIPAGRYQFADVMDDDGLGAKDIPLKVVIDVEGENIRVDFTGTAAQVAGNINATMNATQAAVCYALKALLDPEIPNNQGAIDVPKIVAPEGSLVNATFPAAVAARANTCQRIIDVVLGALAPALPELAVGAANGANTTAVFSGVDPRTGRQYIYLETLGGGFGGRATKDGQDGVQVHITNTSNLPVEAIELEYPLMVETYELIEDSGGAGRYRGGMGIRRVLRPVGHDCIFSGAGERFTTEPWGVFGGKGGRPGRFMHAVAGGASVRLPTKPGAVTVRAGEHVTIESPGAGGYGDPAARLPQAISSDLRAEKFTPAYLLAHYDWRAPSPDVATRDRDADPSRPAKKTSS